MRRSLVVLFACAAMLVSVVVVRPADAGAPTPPPDANGYVLDYPLSADGSYVPISGQFRCAGGPGTTNSFVLWYAPGPSQDYLWTSTLSTYEDKQSVPVTVDGSYRPVAGDFDGNSCTDILWYGPGSAPDFIWWGEHDETFTSVPMTVNGDYRPVVANFDDDGTFTEDVFWYAPGSAQEYFWAGAPDRSFTSSTAPSVQGDYRVTTVRLQSGDTTGVLFHRPGTGQDYIWTGMSPGASQPDDDIAVDINGSYQPLGVGGPFVLLYGAGGAPDFLITSTGDDGSLETVPGTINGTYETGSSDLSSVIVWHAPGSAPDFLWQFD
ncbi:MAG: hypothetical protein U5K30_08690 [Acidimicrobiales bacterium]|nr:hypothetical protein [Acidimicrobiales bacterium]